MGCTLIFSYFIFYELFIALNSFMMENKFHINELKINKIKYEYESYHFHVLVIIK